MAKSSAGRYFEDFRLGERIRHATPRTLTPADAKLNIALTGSRYALFSSDEFARTNGLTTAPFDPLLVFHIVFGKSVPDISLNAVANLAYSEGMFFEPVYPGDTLTAHSDIIGLKQNSNGKSGVVTVRTQGLNQHGRAVLEYCRSVMVNKRDASAALQQHTPELAATVEPSKLWLNERLSFARYDWDLAGSSHAFEDYVVGEKIDHIDGMTLEEAEHQIATRLYQNTARVHFDALAQQTSRFGKRLVYGGVVISIARALAFNGLANAAMMLGINAGRHVAPLFAGDTIYAWSQVLDKAELGRPNQHAGALRLRLVAAKNQACAGFPDKNDAGEYESSVVLDFDYWALIPKREGTA